MYTSKYKEGIWRLYYLPYKKMIEKMMKNITKYNITFIGNSEHVSKQLIDGLDLTVKPKVIYPPVDLNEFSNTNRERDGIITVTRYSKEKNLEKVIDLIGDLKCGRRIFGNVSDVNKQYMNKLIKRGKEKNITFHVNQQRDMMKRLLEKSKVFISTSDETFGIAVIEAIASGCIPIVPNTSANIETVPFKELRVIRTEMTDDEVKERIQQALDGNYDYLLPKLQEHIKKFNEETFQNKFMEIINENLPKV